MSERVLKLSVPTLYFWLAMFYVMFDLSLNIVAELIGFGDREFYKVTLFGWVCGCGCGFVCGGHNAKSRPACTWRVGGLASDV